MHRPAPLNFTMASGTRRWIEPNLDRIDAWSACASSAQARETGLKARGIAEEAWALILAHFGDAG